MGYRHALADGVEQRGRTGDVELEQDVGEGEHDRPFLLPAQKPRVTDSTAMPRPASRLREPLAEPSLARLLLKQ